MTPRAIELYIERVVVYGFGHLDGAVLADALQRALEMRLTESPLALAAGGTVDRLTAPPLAATPQTDSAQLGSALAAALLGALSNDTVPREGRDGTNPRS